MWLTLVTGLSVYVTHLCVYAGVYMSLTLGLCRCIHLTDDDGD